MTLAKFQFLFLAAICLSAYADEEMRFAKGKGDMGQYILQQAFKCGAKIVSTNDLPAINGDWKFSEDQYGAVLQLGRGQFDEVQAFLRKAFGPPAHEPSATTDGGKLGWYAARTSGIGLQFGYNKERTQVIVLRPQKRSDVYKRASELAKTDEDKKVFGDIAKEAKKQEKKQSQEK